MNPEQSSSVADAVKGSWVDTHAPAAVRPYLQLMRADRPIGTWLLLWPGWWALALTAHGAGKILPDPFLFILFGVGAIVMRGAGCVYNDIVDHDFDAKVARTRSRPIPSGRVNLTQAWIFALSLCLIGLVILLQFNWLAIGLGVASLTLIAIYPFMKRVTWWPQFFLGLAFNWGALLGWAAAAGQLEFAALLLYAGGIAWTLGYDTIYAHQDKEDDALIGVKSTARRLGADSKPWLAVFYALALLLFAVAGLLAGAGLIYILALVAAAAHAIWQIRTLDIDNPDRCLTLFRANRDFGWIIFSGILADAAWAGHAWF